MNQKAPISNQNLAQSLICKSSIIIESHLQKKFHIHSV